VGSPILPAFPYSNSRKSGRRAGDLDGRSGFDYQGAKKQIWLIFDFLKGLMSTTFKVNLHNVAARVIKNEDDEIDYIVVHRVLPIYRIYEVMSGRHQSCGHTRKHRTEWIHSVRLCVIQGGAYCWFSCIVGEYVRGIPYSF
jgi:hypothetical protein